MLLTVGPPDWPMDRPSVAVEQQLSMDRWSSRRPRGAWLAGMGTHGRSRADSKTLGPRDFGRTLIVKSDRRVFVTRDGEVDKRKRAVIFGSAFDRHGSVEKITKGLASDIRHGCRVVPRKTPLTKRTHPSWKQVLL